MKIESCSHGLLRYKLTKPVGGSGVSSVDVLVTHVVLQGGCTGMGFSYVLAGTGAPMLAAAHALSAKIEGGQLFHPAATWRALNDTLNRSRRGPNYLALAALDMALWDAYARARGEPLGVAMGGAPRFCLLSLAIPVWADQAWVDRFYVGAQVGMRRLETQSQPRSARALLRLCLVQEWSSAQGDPAG